MRYALINPVWTFEGSTYFGCAEPHFPLELLSAREMLRAAGQEVLLIDAWMEQLSPTQVRRRLQEFNEDFLVIPTAPSYLFWRCPPPELRVPTLWIAELDRHSKVVVIGSTRLRHAARYAPENWCRYRAPGGARPDAASTRHAALGDDRRLRLARLRRPDSHNARPRPTDMRAVGTLDYSDFPVERHQHLHHIFPNNGADHLHHGAEVEFARGCPYACTFCNKTLFRNKYRERELSVVLAEIDQLLARGVDYIYFIDEIFGVGKQVRELLEEIAKRPVSIGFQTRIDLWNEESIDLLARAHCVSFECGVESITDEGRDAMNKNCRITTDRILSFSSTPGSASHGPGQLDQSAGGRSGAGRHMASQSQIQGRLGLRARTHVPLSGLTRVRHHLRRAAG